jgi:hypothetical protein
MHYSTLLVLPAELRLQIWTLALGGHRFQIYCWPSYNRQRVGTSVLNRQRNFASLLRVCRQIYYEARLLPLQHNAFRIRSEDAMNVWFEKLEPWAQQAVAEVHLVTWRATHMIEGLNVLPRQISDSLNLRQLSGLKRMYIEVCWKGGDRDSEENLNNSECRLRRSIKGQNEGMHIVFRRSSFSSIASLQLV